MPMNLGDPFQDDDLRAPPPVPSDARKERPRRKTSLALLQVLTEEPTPAKPPVVHHSSRVSVRIMDDAMETQETVAPQILPVSLQAVKAKPFPKNPLRDEN